MPKRGSDAEDEAEKRAKTDDDGEEALVYSPCVVPPGLAGKMNSLVDILLPAKHLTSDAKQVCLRQVWGTDVYTDDSDLVAALVHTGHVKLKSAPPKTPLLVSLRICPAQATYAASERNGLKSREWSGKHDGVSYKVERCLQHTSGVMPPAEVSLLRQSAITRQIPGSLVTVPQGPAQTFAVPAYNCLVVFSLSSDPWYKYSLGLIADQGTEPSRWTSTRLRKEALYLESTSCRYELALSSSASGGSGFDKYTLSQVKAPHEMDARAVEAAGVPLPKSNLEVLETGLDWEELLWGPSYMRVRGVEYPLLRLLFVPYSVSK